MVNRANRVDAQPAILPNEEVPNEDAPNEENPSKNSMIE